MSEGTGTPKKLKNPDNISSITEKDTEAKTPVDTERELLGKPSAQMAAYKALNIKAIGDVLAGQLIAKGYDVMTLATARADEVAGDMNVSYGVAKSWIEAVQENLLMRMSMKKAVDFDKEKKAKQIFFRTNSKSFNKMLGDDATQVKATGGVATMAITGLSGQFETGKTQVCNDIVVDCLGRLKEKAVYIETEQDTFHLDRLKEIAKARGYNCNWDDLYVCESANIPTVKAQYLQYRLVQKSLENGENIRLVVVDSFNAKSRAGYTRTEMLPVRTREFAEHFLLMDFLAAKYNIAWLLTCQVIMAPRPEQGLQNKMKFGSEHYLVGGDIVLHSINQLISLDKISTYQCRAVLYDSSYLPRNTCEFEISSKGIIDTMITKPDKEKK
jgi:RecA/RadA recombinase